ncbi:MAG TPA: bifunctional pyr operon transcriptional regulator/uracil phosphoribosyltransferase PyrR [Dehalococcoidia bacterium]|jgi:pyrimidine operon attenuation protein/uracil phosphoribosyltransferase|nr:bifunctional pyr operon transcriptional regulator/uracil phosphoribosyltransferase PyrR [Dehalococcoidia bacterium]
MSEASTQAITGDTSGPLLDEAGVRRTLQRLAHEIVEANAGIDELVLVGIQRRGAPLATRLADAIEAFEDERPPTGSLDVTLHRDDFADRGLSQTPQRPTELPDIDGKNVVLIDDVLFTGRTVRAALDALNSYGRPRVVRLAVLVDRGHRELPIRADIVGKNIPTARRDDVQVLLVEEDGRDAVVVIPGGSQS